MCNSNLAHHKTIKGGIGFSGTIRRLRAEGASPGMDNSFMQEAIRLAVENVRSGRGGPFGAIVVKEGRVIAAGTNSVTSANDPTAHAEVNAIREACRALGAFQLTGCEIYTSCEPCPMCLGAIYWARPDRVYFAATASDAAKAGFDDSFIYEELKRPHNERKIPFEPMMREAGLEPFREWTRKGDRIRY
jgi:tRNA(Arg) A34 adenosine deaminase TadA